MDFLFSGNDDNDIANDLLESGIFNQEDIDTLFSIDEDEEDTEEEKETTPSKNSYTLFRDLFYGTIVSICKPKTVNIDISDSFKDDIFATIKFTMPKEITFDDSIAPELNKITKVFNEKYKDYKELLPEDLTTEYLNNRDNQIDFYKKLCIYTMGLNNKFDDVEYIVDDFFGDMREHIKWLLKSTDEVVTKEQSLEIYKKFNEDTLKLFRELAYKTKEEQEFKEV